MRIYAPDELLAQQEPVRWLAPPFLACGAITLLTGAPKYAGKTTFLLALISAMLHEELFLDKPTQAVPVLYYTEESRQLFDLALGRAGLREPGQEALGVVLWRELVQEHPEWPDQAQALREALEAREARLLVVDTFAQIAGLHGEKENNSGDVLAAIKPLQVIAEACQCAIALVHHDNKTPGSNVVGASRGSTALPASVDILMRLTQVGRGGPHRSARLIRLLGRFDEIPEQLGYQRLDCSAVLKALQGQPADGLTVDALATASGLQARTVRRYMEVLQSRQRVTRLGRGLKYDPYRFVTEVRGVSTPTGVTNPSPYLFVPVDPAPLEALAEGEPVALAEEKP